MIAGVVLAAGRSSRMGSHKALLRFREETFLGCLVRALRAGGCAPVLVVVGAPDLREHQRVAAEARLHGAVVAVNPDPDSEQIDSVRVAARRLADEAAALIVTPVDVPGIPASVVSALREAIAAGAPIAVPTHGERRGHPVAFSARVVPELLDPDLPDGMRTILDRYGAAVREVPVDEPEVLLDIDTPADHARLRGTGG